MAFVYLFMSHACVSSAFLRDDGRWKGWRLETIYVLYSDVTIASIPFLDRWGMLHSLTFPPELVQ